MTSTPPPPHQNDIERVVLTVSTIYEDDIKSFIFICRIISSVAFYFGVTKPEFEVRYKGYKLAKQMFDLRLVESSLKHTRSVIVGKCLYFNLYYNNSLRVHIFVHTLDASVKKKSFSKRSLIK